MCQLFDYIEVPGDQAAFVENWLHPLLQHKRPFLRAWSMNAYPYLAVQHEAFSTQADVVMADAEKDKAASVRARARNVRRK